MSFNYIRKPAIVEAYGKTFELPVKTTKFMEQNVIDKALLAKGESKELVQSVLKLIGLFITPQETKLIFPNIDDAIPNEVFAFYKYLCDEQAKATNEIIQNEYSPVETVRKP